MPFTDIDVPLSVTTTTNNPIDDLFVPVLKESTEYDVAVGYFSSGWIRDAAEGIAALAVNGGSSRWIISPMLSEEDWALLSNAEEKEKRDHVNEISLKDVNKLIDSLQHDTRNTIAWLIVDGILSFRIAIPKNDLNGIFHAKIGIFKDSCGDKIAFSGSYNLTAAAEMNWESIDIYSSLRVGEVSRIVQKESEFERMWQNEDGNLDVYKADATAIKPFIEITKYNERPYKVSSRNRNIPDFPKIPEYFLNNENKLREHQETALKNWFKNNGRGIFNMATGSGKTVTALSGITRLYYEIKRREASLVVVITVPYRHLAEQWHEESLAFGYSSIVCYGDYKAWPSKLSNALTDANQGISSLVVVITVNATYSGDKFQEFLRRIQVNFLLIADEMHNLGSKKAKECLPENAQFRMGLSATPIRKYDDIGTKVLERYFGEQIIEYGIKDAINDETLTKYYYYPVLVEFTDEEMDEYRELSITISKLFARQGASADDNPQLKMLLLRRARLIGQAENKLMELRALLMKNKDKCFNLIYVGDDKKEDMRQVDSYVRMIGKDVGMKVRKFTADEDTEARKEILDDFGSGDLQAIVAIRCLDEGVDIPRTESAYIIASTTNPRQFIQRRGRVLRKAQGKKYAYIYDFITVPPSHGSIEDRLGGSDFKTERKLMARELERINEFASSAVNGGEALSKLRDIKQQLNLLDT